MLWFFISCSCHSCRCFIVIVVVSSMTFAAILDVVVVVLLSQFLLSLLSFICCRCCVIVVVVLIIIVVITVIVAISHYCHLLPSKCYSQIIFLGLIPSKHLGKKLKNMQSHLLDMVSISTFQYLTKLHLSNVGSLSDVYF